MIRAITFFIAVVVTSFWTAAALAVPPKVVKAAPDNGDVNVDPNTKEIRITFDQPMGKGMSVVGGGDTYPEVQGRPNWVNPKTLVVRVKLKPNHEYWLSINSDRFQNFTNTSGEPAIPYPIQFRTGAGMVGKKGGASEEKIPGVAENRRALNRLRSAIRNHYSYRERLEIDWDELFKANEAALLAAQSPHDFAKIAGRLLARAEDKHIWLQVDEEIIPSYVRPSVPNANYALLPKLVPNLKRHGRVVVTGRWDDGIGYLAIASWDKGKLEDGKLITQAFDELRDTTSLIIDVRVNGGGAEPLAQELAGHFIAERQLYAKHVYRDPKSPTGFTAPRERWLEPGKDRQPYSGRVAVLSGPAVMSSNESFLLMMKTVPNAVIVGARSQGSSGNPKPHDLGNGVTVLLPSWKDLTGNGKELEGVGIPPDIEVKTTPADFKTEDKVLAAALAHLRNE